MRIMLKAFSHSGMCLKSLPDSEFYWTSENRKDFKA